MLSHLTRALLVPKGSAECIQVLLREEGINLMARNNMGRTAMDMAALFGGFALLVCDHGCG